MAHRHDVQAKAEGGKVEALKSGGKVKKPVQHDAEIAKEAGIKRGGKVHGKGGNKRLKKYARGGGTGSDKHPFSSAHFQKGGSVGK